VLSVLVDRSTLRTLTPALFVFLIKRRAGAYLRSGWRTHYMPMTPAGLLALEQDHAREQRGHPARDVEVRLPEYHCPRCGAATSLGPGTRARYCAACLDATIAVCSGCQRFGPDTNCAHPRDVAILTSGA
jgi:hypothetical protein